MFKVVFVCSGNRCRSPVAEAALRAALKEPWLDVTSAGTLHLGAAHVPHEMLAAAADVDLDLSDHRARNLEELKLSEADLVIGMTLEHVAAASVNAGARPERSFTLTELVDLLKKAEPPQADDPEEYARDVVAAAQAERRKSKSFAPAAEIVDPLGGPRRLYQDVTEQIRDLCAELAAALKKS